MARTHGRVLASIWNDADFRALPRDARLAYVFLISQPDLDHAGVIALRLRRWGKDLDATPAEVAGWLGDLEAGRFIVIDWDEEELLVRSYIRHDGVWKQPNVFKSAAASAAECESPRIKRELLAEIRRLSIPADASNDIQRTLEELESALAPFETLPSPTPVSIARDVTASAHGTAAGDSETVNEAATVDNHETAGGNPSRTLSEPFPKGSRVARGKGKGCSPALDTPFPPSPETSPLPPASGAVTRLPVADGNGQEEGEEIPAERTPESIQALIARTRSVRPGWSTRSIRRALDDPSVTERPWPLVCSAMIAVASDPKSDHPGRLPKDGPWWHAPPARATPADRGHDFDRHPEHGWCTICDQHEGAAAHRARRTA